MRYASVCSGVEAASLAWIPLGWTPVFFAEVEPFPCAVLMQRFNATKPLFPSTPEEAVDEKDRKMRESWLKQINKLPEGGSILNLGDFTKINGEDYVGAIDLLVGGTPCQDLSVAGKRAGFGDIEKRDEDNSKKTRSSLALDFVRLAYEARCQYFVWENVPGVFSSNRGRDFATLLSMFCGYTVDVPKDGWKSSGIVQNRRPDRYGLAWRVLDAQFTRVPGFPFAVPQRRRRVFLVGCLGDWQRAASILLEPDRLQWDTPPCIKTREASAGGAGGCTETASGGGIISIGNGQVDSAMNPQTEVSHTLHCMHDQNAVVTGSQFDEVAGTLKGRASASPFPERGQMIVHAHETGQGFWQQGDVSGTLRCEGENRPSRPSNIVCFHGSQDPISNETHANAIGRNGGLENCICQYGSVAGTLKTKHDGSPCADNGMNVVCYDARGNGDGETMNTITGDHNNRVTDYTPIVQNVGVDLYSGSIDAVSPTCRSASATDCTHIPAVIQNVSPALDSSMYVKNQTQDAAKYAAVMSAECVPLDLRNATRDPEKKDAVNRQGCGIGNNGEPMGTLSTAFVPGVGYQRTIRRLTPLEAERLMGFPDNWTKIPWNGKHADECPDGPRYKACGNSMCVNVMEWIGRRIEQYS